ncbi:MAG: protein translocase subunit SecD, partial [Oscillospiraceae bacterium]
MKKVAKPVFFIVVAIILFLSVTCITGISSQYGDYKQVYVKGTDDIRWGIDIRGGVDVTFTPPEDVTATEDQMKSAEEVIKIRLTSLNITDFELYTDEGKNRIILRFPWKADETDFDPQAAIQEIGSTSLLTFRKGQTADESGKPTGDIILKGEHVVKANVVADENGKPAVGFELDSEGATAFANATKELLNTGVISIWMDETMVSAPSVSAVITDGKGIISGGTSGFTVEDASKLARQINSGALPFKLETNSFSTIDPSMGTSARDAMVLGGAIAFVLVCLFMCIRYKVPGIVASIALLGQVTGSIMAI